MQKEEKGEKRILETETEIREHSRSRSTVLNGAMIRMQTSHWISNKEAKNSFSGLAGWSLTSLGKK